MGRSGLLGVAESYKLKWQVVMSVECQQGCGHGHPVRHLVLEMAYLKLVQRRRYPLFHSRVYGNARLYIRLLMSLAALAASLKAVSIVLNKSRNQL